MSTQSPPTPPRLVRLAPVLLSLLLVVSVATLAAALFLPTPFGRARVAVPPEPTQVVGDPGEDHFVLPEFTLTGRDGKPVTKADLAGKVWVSSFVFTRCTGPCPSITATMARLQSELKLADEPNLRLVTITVDPERDREADLTRYAKKFNAHPERWLFLTGDEAGIHELLNKGFKLGVNRSTLPNPPEGREIDHRTFLEVVDKAGVIRGHFDGFPGANDEGARQYEAKLAALRALVAKLLGE